MIIYVKVKPHSGKQEIKQISSTEYQISLKSAPENNEANLELIKLLKKQFKAKQIKIISGKNGRKKTIEILT